MTKNSLMVVLFGLFILVTSKELSDKELPDRDSIYTKDGQCEMLEDGSIVAKTNVQSLMFTKDSDCIFNTEQGQEVVPVFLAGDQMSMNTSTGVTTFYRKSIIKKKKGRSEMNFCFAKPGFLAKFNEYQKHYLAETSQFLHYCDNAVNSLEEKIESDYGMELRIVTEPGIVLTDSVIVQWHGRPRRTVYKDITGTIRSLPDYLPTIIDDKTLDAALNAYNNVKANGGRFSAGGYPPVAVKINRKFLWVQARYDPRNYTEQMPRCGGVERIPTGGTKKCGPLQLSVVHREPVGPWLDNWRKLRLKITWNKIGEDSKIEVYVDDVKVASWTGLLGRNDALGSYMKYGIYAPANTHNFSLEVKGAYSNVDNI